jgi:hypothetical protein
MDAGFIEVTGDDNREQLVSHFEGFEHGVQDTIRNQRFTPLEGGYLFSDALDRFVAASRRSVPFLRISCPPTDPSNHIA